MDEHLFRSFRNGALAVFVFLTLLIPARAATSFQPPVFFERNDGQSDPSVLYLAHGLGYSFFLTRTGATIALPPALRKYDTAKAAGANFFSLSFVGSNPRPAITGVDELSGHSNYFSGSDPKLWHTNIPQFAKVRYANLYPGVDILFYVRDGQLEYDIVAAPGADISAIRLRETGTKPHLTAAGDVTLNFGPQKFTLRRPRVYQSDPRPRLIPAHYALRGHSLSFQLGSYDRSRPLTIDPALVFSTYLNSNCPPQGVRDEGGCADSVSDIAADSSGVYVAGGTDANVFPGTSPPAGIAGPPQSFILKLDPTGQRIIYASYLAGSGAGSLAVDSQGFAYIAGGAYVGYASIPPCPLTSGVLSGVVPSNSDSRIVPFAAKLSTDGSAIVYATLLVQPGQSTLTSQSVNLSKIAVDSQGALYITGAQVNNTANSSASVWMPLATTPGAFQTSAGTLFVLKLTPNASGLDYSTFIDGHGSPPTFSISNTSAGVAVDSNGDAFVTGSAYTGLSTTPGAYLPTISANSHGAFLAELNSAGSAFVYSTYISDGTYANAIALDSSGEAVVVGSGDPNLGQGFITKFNSTGTALVYSTTIPRTINSTSANSVAVDPAGNAYVVGVTADPVTFQSLLLQPIESYPAALPGIGTFSEEIALKLDTSGNPQWATFLAATNGATVSFSRVATDPAGDAYILLGGSDAGTISDFPTTPKAIGLSTPGLSMSLQADFLLKIAPSLGAAVPLSFPASASFPSENVGTSNAQTDVQLRNYGDAPLSTTVAITGDFSETDTCSAAIPSGSKCDVTVLFTPTATGPRTGLLTFNFGGTFPAQTVALGGTGTAPAVMLSSASLSFGPQSVNSTSAAQQITLTNIGTSNLSVASLQTTAQFAATSTCGAAVVPNGACAIQVSFAPTASGVQTGTLTINDNAANSPQTVALSGNQPPAFALTSGGSSPASATVARGQTASYTLSVTGSYGFSGAVNFTCSGAPANSTCTVSPNPANISGSSAVPVSVSITTQAASGTPGSTFPIAKLFTGKRSMAIGFSSILLFFFLSIAPANNRLRKTCLSFVVILLFTIPIGCGGGSSSQTPTGPGTPAGAYSITVTGSSGTVTQSMMLTLNVS